MSGAQGRIERLRGSLARLAGAPPQSLLIEGGKEAERLDTALFWAMLANCPEALAARERGDVAAPCGECVVCRQIKANEFIDLRIYDGRIPNKQDEEKPGPIRALRIENMRDLKIAAATAPHGEGKRVAIFQGMSQTREEALNSLLKTLEEPSPHTLYVLLAPQRGQLLPTLVSRSFCFTLPWPDRLAKDAEMAEWEDALADFLARGIGFLDRVGAKGALDATLAGRLLMGCQRSLARVLAGGGNGALDKALAPLGRDARKAALLNRWLAEAQDMLSATVAPGRVLEAFASRLFILLRER